MRIAALAALLAVGGCAAPADRINGGEAVLPAGESSGTFLDRVSSLKNVTENDALRGALLLADGKDEAANFAARVERARTLGLVGAGWSFQADRPITKGRLAYIVYQACKTRGGITLWLFGPSQRYCLLELQYQGMISGGLACTPITGLEYVAIITRADTYIQTGGIPDLIQSSSGVP